MFISIKEKSKVEEYMQQKKKEEIRFESTLTDKANQQLANLRNNILTYLKKEN